MPLRPTATHLGMGVDVKELREGGGDQKRGNSHGVNCEITHSKAVKLENENIKSFHLCTHTVIIWHRRTSLQCLVPIIIIFYIDVENKRITK